MAKEEKDASKWGLDWKSIQEPIASDSGDGVSAQKRRRRKLRPIPEYNFLPRRSLPFNLCFFGACTAAGIGAGMLVETWMKKKVAEDGGVIWEFDK